MEVQVKTAGGVAVLTIANPPVNALGAAVRAGLLDAVDGAFADHDVQAIVITGAGRLFVGGADIREFGTAPLPPSLPDVFRRIEFSHKPVIAAVNGDALGGGLELALSCHGRVASPAAMLGLPEINLGFIPGAGGTQRLPRLIGPQRALSVMLEGKSMTAGDAQACGLVDAVLERDLVGHACERALALAASGSWPVVRDRSDLLTEDARASFEASAAKALTRSPGIANVAALVEAVRAAFDLPFDEGLALERSHFKRLLDDPGSKALRYLFFAERQAARLPDAAKGKPLRTIARAAVVGAGTMGTGIAMCFANAGVPVTLIEVDGSALNRGLDRVEALYEQSVKRGSLNPDIAARRMALISGAVGIAAVQDADLIVEAVYEDMAVKCALFSAIDAAAKPGAILATNTSYLDVNVMAAATRRPQDVVGLHFFSPATVMRLVEVVHAQNTSMEVLATSVTLAKTLGKLPVVVGVGHGFIGNRMLQQRSIAAERLLLQGALPHEVDAAIEQFGFRMGPFAMSDLAGLDVSWRMRKANGQSAPVADALCERERYGQKADRGFYLYPDGGRAGLRDPEVEQLILTLSEQAGIVRRGFTSDEIVQRLLYPMINEGARILEEGIAARASDIDVVWTSGYRWPTWLGGPMYWADRIGLDAVADALEGFARDADDARLRPAPLLLRLAREGRSFTQ